MKNGVLFYYKGGGPTARRLARLLGLPARVAPRPTDVLLVRWGQSSSVDNTDHAVNSPESIRLAAHGLLSLEKMQEAGIPVVVPYRSPPEDESLYPIVARRRFNHHAGTDIVLCATPEEAAESGGKFFTRFFSCQKELRVHVFGDTPLRVFRKVPRIPTADIQIKTSLRGWGYHKVNEEKHYRHAQTLAIRAANTLGLTFGGVDIGWQESSGKYRIFEVNTAPSLNSVSILYYAREIEKYLVELEVGYETRGICWADKIKEALTHNLDTE